MKGKVCLYDDFYEGFLHIIMMIVPFIVGILNEILAGNQNIIPISLSISIMCEMYSARNIYKDCKYYRVFRIKIEIVVVLITLAVSLCYTWLIFVCHENNITYNSSKLVFRDYSMPLMVYVGSIIPYLIETIYVLFANDLCTDDSETPQKNNETTSEKGCPKINVSSGNIN